MSKWRSTPIAISFMVLIASWTGIACADDINRNRFAASVAIKGPIGPATARYVKSAFDSATRHRADLIVLQLDTPGGLATSMREIIANVLSSPIPVIGFVAPAGAHAASAGTYILYATNIAAMAPGTNIGAATPVQIGGLFEPSPPGKDINKEKGKGDAHDQPEPANDENTMKAKVTNDAVAFIRSLAELRHRNADWAEQAVRYSVSLSAQAALDKGVIDLIARDPMDLLARIDGREVDIAGSRIRLATGNLRIEPIEPTSLDQFLSVITDPNVAFILLILGLFGLVFEFSNPGTIAPGVIGGICLILGLYALNMLPVDYTGVALTLLGIAFLIAEAFTPTVVLGIGGLVALVIGATMLLNTDVPEFRLSWGVIGGVAVASIGLFTLTLGYVWRLRRQPARTGVSTMLGQSAEVLDWSGETGHVFALGERWSARAANSFINGDRVEVTEVDGLTLVVKSAPKVATSQGGKP